MWERTLSQKLVRLFCEQKVIDEAKADAYVYGYELLISSAFQPKPQTKRQARILSKGLPFCVCRRRDLNPHSLGTGA